MTIEFECPNCKHDDVAIETDDLILGLYDGAEFEGKCPNCGKKVTLTVSIEAS